MNRPITLFLCFQVVDFLSGKAPLNLTMRLGDHMMLIQLQLSTVNSAHGKRARVSPTSSATTTTSTPTSGGQNSASIHLSRTQVSSTSANNQSGNYKPKLDTRALTEASKNLTQTLKQLSSEVLTTKCDGVSASNKKLEQLNTAEKTDRVEIVLWG